MSPQMEIEQEILLLDDAILMQERSMIKNRDT